MHFFRLNFSFDKSAARVVHFYYAGETSPTREEFILCMSKAIETVTDAALLDDLQIIAEELYDNDVFPMIKNPAKQKRYGWTYLSGAENVMMEIEKISFSVIKDGEVLYVNDTELVKTEDADV